MWTRSRSTPRCWRPCRRRQRTWRRAWRRAAHRRTCLTWVSVLHLLCVSRWHTGSLQQLCLHIHISKRLAGSCRIFYPPSVTPVWHYNPFNCLTKFADSCRRMKISILQYTSIHPSMSHKGLLEHLPTVIWWRQGDTRDKSPFHRRATQRQAIICTPTVSLHMHVSGLSEEAEEPAENPRGHRENIKPTTFLLSDGSAMRCTSTRVELLCVAQDFIVNIF